MKDTTIADTEATSPWITTSGAALQLRRSENYIRKQIRTGTIRATRGYAFTWIPKEDLAYLEACLAQKQKPQHLAERGFVPLEFLHPERLDGFRCRRYLISTGEAFEEPDDFGPLVPAPTETPDYLDLVDRVGVLQKQVTYLLGLNEGFRSFDTLTDDEFESILDDVTELLRLGTLTPDLCRRWSQFFLDLEAENIRDLMIWGIRNPEVVASYVDPGLPVFAPMLRLCSNIVGFVQAANDATMRLQELRPLTLRALKHIEDLCRTEIELHRAKTMYGAKYRPVGTTPTDQYVLRSLARRATIRR